MYPFIFSEERIRLAEEQVEKVLTLVGFQPETVLDLCCGPGRHAIILAQRGIQVTGVDRTEFLLNQVRAEAARLSLEIEFVLEEMRRFVRPGADSKQALTRSHSLEAWTETNMGSRRATWSRSAGEGLISDRSLKPSIPGGSHEA